MSTSPHTRHALIFRILGTLEISAGGREIDCAALKPRTMLGLLLCRANRVVPVSALREALWDDTPPRTAHKNLQSYVSTLRSLLAGAEEQGVQLLHRPPGYLLRIGPEWLDALRFAGLAQRGRNAAHAGQTALAADLLGQAVRLWRGPVLPDLASVPAIAAEAERLRERYLVAYEDWAEASLALGRHADLVDGLDELCWQYPLRERLRHTHMLALYRAGRQTDALAQFDAIRQTLARELGLAPSPLLRRLQEAILAGDRSLDLDTPGRALPVAPRCVATEAELARDIADFTGRAHEVGAVLDVLSTPAAVVTVAGAAGVGKTALAVHCVHRLGGRYPDGRVLVRLRGRDGRPRHGAELVAELLRGLGRAPVPASVDERALAALLREATAARRVLFVLDDAATEEQVRSLLSAAGDAAVLITSRRRMTGLELAAHLRLEPMTRSESVSLLGRLIGPERVASGGPAARRLAEICGGLPLAVRIVGAKLAALPHLPLARYADRLADERRLLDQLRAGDLELRSRLARWVGEAALDDRAALRGLAAAGDRQFTLAEVAGTLRLGVAEAEAAIERLIEAHLVEARTAEVQAHAGEAAHSFALPGLLRVLLREGDGL